MESAPETAPPATRTPDGERIHKLTLLRGSIVLMRHLLIAQGWASKSAQIRRGKKLRALLPKLDVPADAAEDWENEAHAEISVPEGLRKIGADCLSHFVGKAALGATDSVDCLLTEFGVVEE